MANQKGNTALHVASLSGQLDVVKVLLVNGSSVNARSKVSVTTRATRFIARKHSIFCPFVHLSVALASSVRTTKLIISLFRHQIVTVFVSDVPNGELVGVIAYPVGNPNFFLAQL